MSLVNFSNATVILVGSGTSRKRWHVATTGNEIQTVSDVPTSTYTESVQSPEGVDGTMQKFYAKPADTKKLKPLNSNFGSITSTVTIDGTEYIKFWINPEKIRVIDTYREDVTDKIFSGSRMNTLYVLLEKDSTSGAQSATKNHEGFLKVNYFEVDGQLIRGNGSTSHGFLDLELQVGSEHIYGNIIPAFQG